MQLKWRLFVLASDGPALWTLGRVGVEARGGGGSGIAGFQPHVAYIHACMHTLHHKP